MQGKSSAHSNDYLHSSDHQEPLRIVNWIIQKPRESPKVKDRFVHQQPRKVRWCKESFEKLLPTKLISLTTNELKQNKNQLYELSHQSNSTTGATKSHKNSLEKKDKLTVMSKRLSVRKINDFMNSSWEDKNQEDLDNETKKCQSSVKKEEISLQSNQEHQPLLREKSVKDQVGIKKKIRISLRRDKIERN